MIDNIKKKVEAHYQRGEFLKQETLGRYERELNRKGIEYDNNYGNILVISDLHCPFLHIGAIKFLKHLKEKYNPKRVVFLGDIIDNHFLSFHDTDPNGLGGRMEFETAKKQIQSLYKIFPEADVMRGNHDDLRDRKAFKAGIIDNWLRPIEEVLEVDNWKFHERLIINDILFTHGLGMQATSRMRRMLISVVQGHYHTKTYLHKVKGMNKNIFAMQLGCLMNQRTYAAAYSRFKSNFQLNAGVIKELKHPEIIDFVEEEWS